MGALLLSLTVLAACSSAPAPVATTSATTSAAPTSTQPTTTAPVTRSPPPHSSSAPPRKPSPAPPAPVDPLTGGPLHAGPVIAVKIDNTGAGFPQFGISDMDVTYIEQVEGGLTRMMAVFHSVLPAEAGPVRSIRSTDIELLTGFGRPILVGSGGAGGPMQMLRNSPIIDATAQSGGTGFWRANVGDSTHNLHVDVQRVAAAHPGKAAAQDIGFSFAVTDPRVAAGKAVSSIDVTMISARTGFRFADGRYQVFHRSSPYLDAAGHSIYTDNVLVQHVIDRPDGTVDSVGSPSYLSHTVGSGAFTLYRDGHAIEGTWSRDSPTARTRFLDPHGKPVPFKPGKTWVMLAPQSSSVSTS